MKPGLPRIVGGLVVMLIGLAACYWILVLLYKIAGLIARGIA